MLRRRGPLLSLRALSMVPLVFVVTAGTTACGDGGSEDPLAEDTGVAHVHGLGVDPGDGMLYAATHHGVFRVPDDGDAKRIADRFQDTMGFTVTGSRRFLASGHPSLEDDHLRVEGKPPLLGLIESTDAAETWHPLSLLGDADFHGLVAAHGRVYGVDSTGGRFMVTSDRRQWETRSEVQLNSFAVSPEEADVIVGTSPNGTVRSADGGRTWSPVPGGPGLLSLSWGPTELLGVAADGELWGSADGLVWAGRGEVPGSYPEAILTTGKDLYVATSTGIHQSPDGGKRWRLRFRNPG